MLCARVPGDISQRLLGDAETRRFEITREPLVFVRQLDYHFRRHAHTLFITIDVPAQSCSQTEIVEQWGTQIDGKIAHQTKSVVNSVDVVFNTMRGFGSVAVTLNGVEVH